MSDRHSMIRSAGVVGSLTLASRGLGLIRDILMAGFFGTTLSMSAFVVAFTIPNLFRRLFGEGALSSAFVPVFVEARHTQGDPSAWLLARRVITLTAAILVALTLAGILGASVWLKFAEAGTKTGMILELLQIMLPYMVFICLAALSMAILNAFGHFAVPAATPCLLNVIWIGAVLLLVPHVGETLDDKIRIVAWAVIIAGILQLAVQLPILRRFGYKPGLSFAWHDPLVSRVLKLMGPAALGLAITQVNVIVDRLLATWVGSWAPAALFFSERLIYFPLGIFATAMSTVLLPAFSGHAARDDHEEMTGTLNHSLRLLLFLMIPAALGLLVMARPIVQMIFQWREFTPQSTELTARALQFYAPGLIVFSLAKIFVPAFYGKQDTRTPVRIGVQTVAINLVLNLLFVFTWPLYWKHAGLACATVLAETYYAVRLALLLQKKIGSPGWSSVLSCGVRSFLLGLIMAGAAWASWFGTKRVFIAWALPSKLAEIGAVTVGISIGTGTYFLLMILMRSREWRELVQSLFGREKFS